MAAAPKPKPVRPPPLKGRSGKPAVHRDQPREVRIVGGLWKRTRLPVVDAPGLRPTPDRVRETVFNWLGQDLTGWRVVDAYAGTGALGFEAASRGAAEVVLVEREGRVVDRLHEVRTRLKAEAVVTVERGDAMTWLKRAAPGSLDLVFVDPPYDAGLVETAMAAAAPALAVGGWLYAEGAAPIAAPADGSLMLVRADRAGAVHFHLFQRSGAPEAEG